MGCKAAGLIWCRILEWNTYLRYAPHTAVGGSGIGHTSVVHRVGLSLLKIHSKGILE